MAVNFKDTCQKLADALRIQQTLIDVIPTEGSFVRLSILQKSGKEIQEV
jgi:hypothetical protein